MQETLPNKIGFAEGILDERSVRFDVLSAKKDVYLAIDKPAGFLLDAYLSSPPKKSMIQSIKKNLEKPEFKKFGITSPMAVNQIDFNTSGIGLIATNKTSTDELRNAYWSAKMTFEYTILCRNDQKLENKFDVDLPILLHEERPLWIVSHRFGKSASTSFEHIENLAGGYSMWKATANAVRPQQIRVHAAEAGLKIVGEKVYSKTGYIYPPKPSFGKSYEIKAVYPFLSIHLSKVIIPAGICQNDEDIIIEAPLPKKFKLQIDKYLVGKSFGDF